MDDKVNHPAHYTFGEHEVIEVTELLSFCLGNAIKYILRSPHKGHESEDLEKACWYIRRAAENEGVDPETFLAAYDVLNTFDDDDALLVLLAFAEVDPEKRERLMTKLLVNLERRVAEAKKSEQVLGGNCVTVYLFKEEF